MGIVLRAPDFIGLITSADGLRWDEARSGRVTEKRLARADGPRVLCLAVKEGNGIQPLQAPTSQSTQ